MLHKSESLRCRLDCEWKIADIIRFMPRYAPSGPPPPLGCDFDFWWSMNRYNILNLESNEPCCWKCFSKLHDPFGCLLWRKRRGEGRESFAAKAIIASSIEVFEARFQQHRYQEKVAKKSLSMLRWWSYLSKEINLILWYGSNLFFSVISTTLQRHDRKLENESVKKALTWWHEIT